VNDVFRALADPSRRRLLDRLNDRTGQSLRELCAGLGMARQSVSKHLAVLEEANLVWAVRRGREKVHHLNAEPINAIAQRWIHRYALEAEPMGDTAFVYTTIIHTTPERVWSALTEPEFTRQYWHGVEMVSDWKVGSPLLLRHAPDAEPVDQGQAVLEYDPFRRLAYSWHKYLPEQVEYLGWSAEKFAELQKEPQSRVAFDIEEAGPETVRLTVTHDGFPGETEMYKAISGALSKSGGGWLRLVASIKTLLETGAPMPA
jgi:uncharacterized protein YndB with AHSA1/START domain/DNA-binding transcriptional ArsR family regulator